jgi:hypothetical protein
MKGDGNGYKIDMDFEELGWKLSIELMMILPPSVKSPSQWLWSDRIHKFIVVESFPGLLFENQPTERRE